MNGYELHKSGARVNELLERHFIVPTLASAPSQKTLSWNDGKYVVSFRIGELCRVKENEQWQFYRLHDVVNGVAYWQKANASELPDMSDYYTKDEINTKLENIEYPEDESVKTLSQSEYDELVANDSVATNTIYLVTSDGSPTALYVGKVLIAQREEGSKGFAYNFPIIF